MSQLIPKDSRRSFSEIKPKLRSAMRRLWLWYSIPRKEAIAICKIARGKYRCSACQTIVSKLEVDHIKPAGAFNNWEEFGSWCQRLFCNIDNLQAICHQCHINKKA